jgi:hypothetical protein
MVKHYDFLHPVLRRAWDNAICTQTFTTVGSFDISKVSLKLFRSGSPGDITVGIWDTSGGKPSGGAVVSVTQSGNGITTDSGGEWVDFVFASPYTLSATHLYAIVWSAGAGSDISNYGAARRDGTPPTYADGQSGFSSNSGGSWTMSSTTDYVFETYSGTGAVYVDAEASIIGAGSISASGMAYEFIDGEAAIAGSGSIAAYAIANVKPVQGYIRLLAAGNDSVYFSS